MAKTLIPYAKNIFVAVCAVLILIGSVAFTPWVNFQMIGSLPADSATVGTTPPTGFDAPVGFEPPAGFEVPAAEANTTGSQGQSDTTFPPTGFPAGRLPGGAPGTLGQFLVPLAAVVGLGLAGFSAWKPRHSKFASGVIFVFSLAAAAYFIIFFAMDALLPIPISLVSLTSIGFWLGLVGTIGLFAQLFIPRLTTDESRAELKVMIPKVKRSGLSLSQNLSVAIDALMANKVRSALTMLGIIIGVAAVVSMLAVGRGASASVTEQITSTGLDLLTISPGSGTGAAPGPGAGGGSGNADTLTYDDALAIEQNISGIYAVLPQYNKSLDVRSDSERLQTTVRGVTENYADVRNIDIEIGGYFSQAAYNNAERVAVLGQRAAEELFGGLNPVGREVRISGTRFEVIGVLAEQDGGFGTDPNLEIHVPLTIGYRQLFDARRSGSNDDLVTSIVVGVTDLDNVEGVQTELTALLRREHRLEADEEDDFSVLNQQSLLDTASQITGIFTVLLGAIAGVSLLVGGIGIMNIMLVSVTERTKEIGLRKALGARRGHISQQFFIETIFLSTLGGILGVVVGIGIAQLVNASGVLAAVITWDSIVLGLGFSAVVGIFFGVYPANRAAALEPIEALRYE
ncbi:MAG: ABC transporter permease [Chloroflexota bacterium]|nr:ABC transporter permease [Chloroflexota bacterium]